MVDETGIALPVSNTYRIYRRRGDSLQDLEIVTEFVNIGTRELEFLRVQLEESLEPGQLVELNGELVRSSSTVASRGSETALVSYATPSAADQSLAPQRSSPPRGAEEQLRGVYEQVAKTAEMSLRQTQRLTEMTVQQHEYMFEELRRLRHIYEEEFSAERALLRQLRAAWIESACSNEAGIEDVVRFIADRFKGWNSSHASPTAAPGAPHQNSGDAASSTTPSASKTTS